MADQDGMYPEVMGGEAARIFDSGEEIYPEEPLSDELDDLEEDL